MQDVFTITLPETASKSDVQALRDSLKQMESVKSARSVTPRGVDPNAVMVWVQVASGALGAISTGVPLIKGAIDQIRGKGIKGVTIELPSGVKISVDNASAADIEKLVRAAGQGQA